MVRDGAFGRLTGGLFLAFVVAVVLQQAAGGSGAIRGDKIVTPAREATLQRSIPLGTIPGLADTIKATCQPGFEPRITTVEQWGREMTPGESVGYRFECMVDGVMMMYEFGPDLEYMVIQVKSPAAPELTAQILR